MRRTTARRTAKPTPPSPLAGTDGARTSPSCTATTCALACTSGAPISAAAGDYASGGMSTSLFDAAVEDVATSYQPAPDERHRIPARHAATSAPAVELGASYARHADAGSQPSAAAQQPSPIPSLLSLLERFKSVFLTGEDGPVATNDGGVAKEATIELVLAVRDAVSDLWKAHEADIKRICAPFMPQNLIAKQEVFGFALADALGRPVLPGDKAMKVGQNGDNAVRWAEGSKDRTGKLTAARDTAPRKLNTSLRIGSSSASLHGGGGGNDYRS